MFRLIGRLGYAVFFVIGGFFFAIPKWILFGTRGSRDRKKALKLQKRIAANQEAMLRRP